MLDNLLALDGQGLLAQAIAGGGLMAQAAVGGLGGGSSGGGGAAQIVANLGDLADSLRGLIAVVCYILGIALVVAGLVAARKTAEAPSQSRGGFGDALASLGVGCTLVALPSFVGMGLESLFGAAEPISTISSLAYAKFTDDVSAEGQRAAGALAVVVNVVGLIAVVRGLLIIRASANGDGNSSYGSGITFLVSGLILVNILGFADKVGISLGVLN
jgi:intracellular multiplication protein IcmC